MLLRTHYASCAACYPNQLLSSWWRMTGSNRRPPACKAGALPAELIPLSLDFDKRRIAALLASLHSFRYAADALALHCLLLEAHRLCFGSALSTTCSVHWFARTKRVKAEPRAAYALVCKRGDNAESRRLSQTNGGSGWVRTTDPRLIKTVL